MRVLIVDDEARVLEGLERIIPQLWPHDEPLEVTAAPGGAAALAAMERAPADLVLTDMRMPGMDGAELLARVHQRWPAAMRVVLSGYMADDAAVRSARHAHQFLAKPCPPAALTGVLDRAYGLTQILSCEHTRRLVGALERLPTAPKTYLELERLLDAGDADLGAISRLVERDPALTAKTLQLVNSSFFARRSPVEGVGDAISRIGLRTLRALAASAALFTALTEGMDAAFVEAAQRRASRLALVARELAGAAAYLPAVLCDVGLLVLHASRLGDDAEAMAAHPRIGAYLLTLWGFQGDVVQAVLRHHEEPRDDDAPTTVAVSCAARWLGGTLSAEALCARYGRLPTIDEAP